MQKTDFFDNLLLGVVPGGVARGGGGMLTLRFDRYIKEDEGK